MSALDTDCVWASPIFVDHEESFEELLISSWAGTVQIVGLMKTTAQVK